MPLITPWQRTPLNRTLLKLALPTIAMNLTVPLLGAVDTAVVGHLDQTYYLGAVSLGSLAFTILTWACAFFRMATVGLAAQAQGRGDADETVHVLGRGVLLSVTIGTALALLHEPLGRLAFAVLGGSDEVQRYGREFLGIVVQAMPAVLTLLVFQGWFYGVKRPGFPVALTILVNLINIALNLTFVWGFGLGVRGVAYATLTAQYLGLVLALAGFAFGFRSHALRLRLGPVLALRPLAALLRMNRDIFLRTAGVLFANGYFMAKSAELGDVALAANAILVTLRQVSTHALDGFATAAEVVVGEAIGAGNRTRLLAAIGLAQTWGLWIGGALSLAFLAGAPFIPLGLTSHAEVQAAAWGLYAWIVAEPMISNVCFLLDGVFIGATATRTMRNSMLVSVLAVFLPAALLLPRAFGMHGLWAAYELLFIARAATLQWVVERFRREPGLVLT